MDVRAVGFELKVGVPGMSGAAAHALAREVVRRHDAWKLSPGEGVVIGRHPRLTAAVEENR